MRMNRQVTLNGKWKLTYNEIEDKDKKWNRWIDATVPGDVHLDLMACHLICDPLVSDNNKKCEWIEDMEWWYKREIWIEESTVTEKMELVCDGLDLTADIWVNGISVGHSNNMFVQHRFDVSKAITAGCNEILIRLDVGFDAVKGKPVEKYAHSWNAYELRRPWMRKAQQCFYWDVAPRLVTCGIWRDIYIDFFEEVILRDVYVTSKVVDNRAFFNAGLNIESLCDRVLNRKARIEADCGKERKAFEFELEIPRGTHKKNLEFYIDDPKLWWPNGMGDQNLYNLEIILMGEDGGILTKRSVRHGIRTIEVLQEELNDKEKTFTFVVNGMKIFAKGGNWVPSDCIYGRINYEKEYKLLTCAKDANMNMMRVWGGGVYPDTFFYDICDELGIMVWQDFMYACGYYPDYEEDFYAAAAEEAEKVVRKFRNHASLALWCGNNENYQMSALFPEAPFDGLKIYSELLPEICGRLDAKTYYHPSSPYPGQVSRGDQHVWSYTLGWISVKNEAPASQYTEDEKKKVLNLWDYAEDNHKFVSEFGFYGPSNMSSVAKFMGENPVVLESPVYNHHRNYFEDDFINEILRRYYKPQQSFSPGEFTMAGQMLQGEILKHVLEEFRSRMYVCSGTLFWEYNDTWGHVGYAPLDYYLSVKPVYYYMKNAFAPVHAVFANNGADILLLNDTAYNGLLTVKYGCMDFAGHKIFEDSAETAVQGASKVHVASLAARIAGLSCINNKFLYAEIYKNGERIDRNRQFLENIQNIEMAPDTLQYNISRENTDTWRIELKADQFVWMVKIDFDDDYFASDNGFDLWPGEMKTVTIRTNGEVPELHVKIEDMNMYVCINSGIQYYLRESDALQHRG